MKIYVGEDDGQHITLDTTIIFEWLHVRKLDGDPHVCQISYRHLMSLGPYAVARPSRPPLHYRIFDNFAANICQGLRFCRLMHEGLHLCLERCLPARGIDVLNQPVYWQLPNGVVRCAEARNAQPFRGVRKRVHAARVRSCANFLGRARTHFTKSGPEASPRTEPCGMQPCVMRRPGMAVLRGTASESPV